MGGFNHYLEATLTPGRNRVLKKKGSLSGSTIAFTIRSVDLSLSIRLMVSLSIKHLANEPLSVLKVKDYVDIIMDLSNQLFRSFDILNYDWQNSWKNKLEDWFSKSIMSDTQND